MPRRMLLRAGMALPWAAPALAAAQGLPAGWPNRPFRLIVPFPPGGTTDLLARLLSDGLAARLGQPVVAENRGGAGGAVGAELAARMEPDGYNLFFGTIGSAAIIPNLQARLNYRPGDLVPVTLFADLPNIISVAKNARWKTLAELLDEAKRNPGKLSFASSGIGSSLHLSGELLKAMAGVDILHVPFRGGADTANEIMAGRVDFGVNNLPSAIGLIRGGEMRGLAVTSTSRSPALPEVPTVAETPGWPLAGYDATAWFGLQVPIRTAEAVIARLNAETNAVLADTAVRARMEMVGARPLGGSPADFAAHIRRENEKWAEVIRRSGARAE
jgi:tripartite-type tricarboxylate transporter receptor subunit TctC